MKEKSDIPHAPLKEPSFSYSERLEKVEEQMSTSDVMDSEELRVFQGLIPV